MKVIVDRDSVCAGDDAVSHTVSFDIDPACSIVELIQKAQQACPLAGIAGGRATWLIDVAAGAGTCIGVMAQQWRRPKLTIPEATTVASLLGSGAPTTIYFRYWCQSDPEAVFQAVLNGRPLPSRY
jgi:hypothetical protein